MASGSFWRVAIMMRLDNEIRWEQAVEAGKKNLMGKRLVDATRHFMVAEGYSSAFGGNDVRRGLTISWMAVGYYKLGSYSLSEAFFKEALDILEMNLTSEYAVAIATNLTNLVAIYVSQGRKGEAIRVQSVIRRHLMEAGYEGALTMNYEPAAPRSLFETLNDEGEAASRAMSRLFEARKLKQMWPAQV
jgi:hypothetical protein